jgi:hypothetical protein
MAYTVFARTAVRIEAPTVSIVPDGRIVMNAAAVRIFVGFRVTSVLLLWDEANRKVAIKAASKGNANTFAVSIVRGTSGSIRAKSFLSHVGWNARKRVRLPASWNEKEGMFEITLPIESLGSRKYADVGRKVNEI